MNKADIVMKLAEGTDFSKAQAQKMLDSLNQIVTNSLKRGEKVVLPGFGTFLVSQRVSRKGRNPHTGEAILLKASKTPRFRAGKSFKNLLNNQNYTIFREDKAAVSEKSRRT